MSESLKAFIQYFNNEYPNFGGKPILERYKVEFDAFDNEFIDSRYYAFQSAWQHQQAKVEELQRINQMLNDNIKEQGQKLVYQNEVIETQAEKLLGLRDEKAELQKGVDKAIRFLVEAELYQSEPNIDLAVKALKGEGQ